MKKIVLKTVILILFSMFAALAASFAKSERYPNTLAKDFMADAPWRVQGKTVLC
ncbi:hypothetical protein [Desulfonema ishimotonii]|uniref:hypothetical protein n=1 Tax=Desulfonema ishimotonii TaxID=45657 RepID=UPI00140E8F2D|nr:hypothetical protein [Desulfonema ishimotonii]